MTIGSCVSTRCPVVRTDRGPWSRWVDLSGGLGIMGRVTFDAEVLWVRETYATWRVVHADGTVGRDASRHSDHYGYATSMREMVDQGRTQARRLGLGPGSRARVEVVATVEEAPLVRGRPGSALGGRPSYLEVGSDWARADDPALAAWEGDPGADRREWPAYLRRVASEPLVLWSSAVAEGGPEAAATFDAAWARMAEGLPADALAEAAARMAAWRAAGMTLD